MEKMPYRSDIDMAIVQPSTTEVVSTDWRASLPVLSGRQVTLRVRVRRSFCDTVDCPSRTFALAGRGPAWTPV